MQLIKNKLFIVLMLFSLFLGGASFFFLPEKLEAVRIFLFSFGIIAACVFGLLTQAGHSLRAYIKASYIEVRKVVWPTRKEAAQVTALMFLFILLVALYFWIIDKIIEWGVFSLVLGWKK